MLAERLLQSIWPFLPHYQPKLTPVFGNSFRWVEQLSMRITWRFGAGETAGTSDVLMDFGSK